MRRLYRKMSYFFVRDVAIAARQIYKTKNHHGDCSVSIPSRNIYIRNGKPEPNYNIQYTNKPQRVTHHIIIRAPAGVFICQRVNSHPPAQIGVIKPCTKIIVTGFNISFFFCKHIFLPGCTSGNILCHFLAVRPVLYKSQNICFN